MVSDEQAVEDHYGEKEKFAGIAASRNFGSEEKETPCDLEEAIGDYFFWTKLII